MSHAELMVKLAAEWLEEARLTEANGMHIMAENCRKIAAEYQANMNVVELKFS